MKKTATLTEFLRTPKDVIAMVENGTVRITRRDAADLVMMRAGDLEFLEEGIGLASRIMRSALAAKGSMADGLKDTFAWVALFSDGERAQFAAEMDRLVWSAAELGAYQALLDEFRRWEGTAEAYAEGMPRGTGDDLTWLDESVDVERP
jgi:hypothetical protein